MTTTTNTSLTINGLAGSLNSALYDFLVTALGWSRPYVSSNVSVYRQPSGTNQMYLRVDDSAGTTATIRAYAAMSDVNTGTDPFPTVAQASSGLTYTKSDSATSATRQCIAISNGSLLHFFNSTTASQWSSSNLLTFGDVPSLKPNDLYNTYLMAGTPSEAVAGAANINAASTGHYICRAHTNTGSALAVGKYSDGTTGALTTPFGGSGPAYPSPVSGRMRLLQLLINEPGASDTRALLPGIWGIGHTTGRCRTHGETDTGAGALSGRTFMFVHLGTAGSMCAIETSNTW